MGIKRPIEDSSDPLEKKSKVNGTFPFETFVKNLKDPESSFLALTEFNEHIRQLSSEDDIHQLMGEVLQALKSNLDDILTLITEEKRKASENITLYRFLTTLLEYLSWKNDVTLSDLIVKKFMSISNSIYTIYFMLSSHSTASHLKITLRFLISLVEQNEFSCRSIFSLIDFKRPCWKILLKRRDVRDVENVRYWTIKFFLSPLIYQHVDSIRNLIKEQEMFREIFYGLVYDHRPTVEFILGELKSNILMVNGLSKTDKLHLFDDRNLKALAKLYHWAGPKRQKDLKEKKNKKRDLEEFDEEVDEEENEDRNEIRRLVHQLFIILFNSKNYGIQFFDLQFGTSNKNANPILLKLLHHFSNQVHHDEYIANFLLTSLSTCPDLLQPYFHFIAQDYLSPRSKNLLEIFTFLCDILQEQKPLQTWSHHYQTITDPMKLADIFIHLTIPTDILNKFDQIVGKNSDLKVQLIAMKFLSITLKRIEEGLTLLQNETFPCDQRSAIESYQQAILRFLPKGDFFSDLLNLIKTIELSDEDRNEFIEEYLNLFIRYSSSSFLSISPMNFNFDLMLSNSILHLLNYFKENQLNNLPLIEKYFQSVKNLLRYRDSTDDATWARHNKELGSTPIRMLLKLSKHLPQIDQMSMDLASMIMKFSSMIENEDELILWFYTWLKFGANELVEEFLSQSIEKLILNPYPLVEKSNKNDPLSLMIYSALDSIQHGKPSDVRSSKEIDEYLTDVLFQIFIGQTNRSAMEKTFENFKRIFLSDRSEMKLFRFFDGNFADEVQRMERFMLAEIDLKKGPDRIQIDLAMKLNLWKIFSLKESSSKLRNEMIQCLNIVLLLHDPQRSFVDLFDKTIEHLQSYSTSIDEFLVHLIEGLDRNHQTNDSKLKSSKVLLQCLKSHRNNLPLIQFLANYLSSDYREEYFSIICENLQIDPSIFELLIREIPSNENLVDQRYFDVILDHLKQCDEANFVEVIRCLFILIDRLKKIGSKEWKTSLRLKQKLIWKLMTKNSSDPSVRSSIATFIVRTFLILRSNDRTTAMERLMEKSSHAPLLFVEVLLQLLREDQMIDVQALFQHSLPQFILHHSSEPIVLEFFKLFNEKYPEEKEQILQLLQRKDSPEEETHRLFLLLKLFPDAQPIAEQIYQSLIEQGKTLLRSSCLNVFKQCSAILLADRTLSIDYEHFISLILKSFTTFTRPSLELIEILLKSFLIDPNFDRKVLAKLFARLLKHRDFLDALSSTSNRAILVDLLSLFVTHYNAELSSVTIDCSKHFPMLLAIYHPTLSDHDQHTLACMYHYEKAGYSMESICVWGEAALEHFSSTTDSKAILYQMSKLDQVMDLVDDRMMLRSIQYYPVTRRLRNIEPKVFEQGDQIYDPAYLIPVFYHSLGSECLVKCQQFVEKHCLAYCLMALSSRCGLLRAVVYNCLFRFEQHLVSQRFYCKEQILTLMTLLKRSIKKSNLKLAPVVALFLSKLVDLFTHPESKIYRTITRFLLKQPYIDLVHVPLFGELFHSSHLEYKYERSWMLTLLKHGIKDTIDYTLCSKAYVYKTLMAFYDCSLCDETTKLDILQVFHATSQLQEILLSLIFDYGFLLWLQRIIPHCSSESVSIVATILENIATRLTKVDNQVLILEFDSVLTIFMRRLKNETNLSSTITNTVNSMVFKHQTSLQSLNTDWISSVDVQQIQPNLVVAC